MGLQKLTWLAVLLLGSALAGCAPEQEPPAPEAQTQATAPQPSFTPEQSVDVQDNTVPVIVFLGDSLTAGFGLGPEFALPEQINERLEAAGQDVRVINAGVSGDTTSGGLARYDFSVASANPDLVFVALGANDYLGGGSP